MNKRIGLFIPLNVFALQPLDYEKKKSYLLQIKVQNTHPDPHFRIPDADIATVSVNIEDVDEPPQFEKIRYILEVKEDAALGTVIGSVSAVDPDMRHSPVK